MKLRSWIPGLFLSLLLVLAAVGWVWTREPLQAPTTQEAAPAKQGLRRSIKAPERLVDQSPLFTARSLMPLAVTSEEQLLARQAERLANHEVDLAFTDALRRAAETPAPDTPEIKALAAAKAKAQAQVETDHETVARLSRELAALPESRKAGVQDQLDVAQAQLELDQDELDSAADDLARVGGDPQARIRRLRAAHEAADKESAQILNQVRPTPFFQGGSLAGRYVEWAGLRAKAARLAQARQEALTKAENVSMRHDAIAAEVKQAREEREAAKVKATSLVKQGADKAQAKQALSDLRQYASVQRRLSDMGRRILDQRGLAEVYANWGTLVVGYETTALHGLLNRVIWVLAFVLLAYMAGFVVDHLFHKAAEDNKGLGTLRVVVKLVLQIACVLTIGFIIFGMPAQTSTVLGLAGAGLTVAMKDFIVAFFGWFILMGRNGIRVGDWVEIRGVGGEVVEIGLLRTVVMETGSWSDAGHPTGRRVAFVNNFAIEGHFFNFSTSGQWMWDELTMTVPAGQDPYPVADSLQKVLDQETEANARLAEKEWQGATARYHVQAFSAAPALNVVPTATGVEIRARYITRAFERHETRLRLNQAIVKLLHGPRTPELQAPMDPESKA